MDALTARVTMDNIPADVLKFIVQVRDGEASDADMTVTFFEENTNAEGG
jgi:hypothetical protein